MVLAAPDEHLEAQMCSLAARVAAATCEFLLAVAEYDRRRGWERWECRDMAAWLSWKCGISPVTAREQVRVARALGEYDLVRGRFQDGRLTYSQVRAILRAATPETEAALVELATVSTAAQLEEITRAFRRTRQAAAETAEARHAARYIRYSWDDEGNLVGSFKLPAEAGAALAGAIDTTATADRVQEADAEGARDGYGAARADALIELVTAGAARHPDETDQSDYLVTVVVDSSTLGAGPDEPLIGECRIQDGPGLAVETARRISCDAAVVRISEDARGRVLDLGRRRRFPSRALKTAMRRRDRHCQFPGCHNLRVHAHHIRHWSAGGATNLDNLVSLCGFHHRRVHEGGYRILLDADGGRHFHHPSGYELDPASRIGPAPTTQSSPPPAPYTSGWDGSRLDLPLTVDCLLQCSDAAESPTVASEANHDHPGKGARRDRGCTSGEAGW